MNITGKVYDENRKVLLEVTATDRVTARKMLDERVESNPALQKLAVFYHVQGESIDLNEGI